MPKAQKGSLVDKFTTMYVNKDGHTITEAVDLALLSMRLAEEFHKSMEIASRKCPEQASPIVDYYLSLANECASKEAFEHFGTRIRAALAQFKGVNDELGLQITDATYSVFQPILSNKMYLHERAHIILLLEMKRMIKHLSLAYMFAGINQDISLANMQCQWPMLESIAFLCTEDLQVEMEMARLQHAYVGVTVYKK